SRRRWRPGGPAPPGSWSTGGCARSRSALRSWTQPSTGGGWLVPASQVHPVVPLGLPASERTGTLPDRHVPGDAREAEPHVHGADRLDGAEPLPESPVVPADAQGCRRLRRRCAEISEAPARAVHRGQPVATQLVERARLPV